jgi:hypothetical protein
MSVPGDRPPPRDIPVAVPGDLVFVRQPGLVAYAGAFTVSSAGFEFMVRIAADVTGHPELVPESWALHLDQRDHQSWLEVRFADGRACATDLNTSTWPGTSGDIRLKFLFGEDHDGCANAQWWVSPLPPPGLVELALHLSGQTVYTAALDAGTLLDAAATVERA